MPETSSASLRAHRQHIDQRLVIQLRLLGVIFLIMFGIIAFDVARNQISWWLAVWGVLLGVGVGLIVSRMRRIVWDAEARKVIGQMDWIGGVILVLYLLFMLNRNWIFGHWVHGVALGVFTLALSAGSMLGRIWATRYGIRKTLAAWGIGAAAPEEHSA